MDLFEGHLRDLWLLLVPIMGPMASMTVFRRGLANAAVEYPFLKKARVDLDGPKLEELRAESESLDGRLLLSGLVETLSAVEHLLTLLAGDILAKKVAPVVGQLRNMLGEG